jgi:hypothetical protein
VLTLATFEALLEPCGQEALAAAEARQPSEATLLSDLAALRGTFGAPLAAAAVETVLLRMRAATKFSRADAMYFTRDALEQATSEVVARHRAQRYAGTDHIWDLCCGIGGDLLQLAAETSSVSALDYDPLRLRMAECNAEVYGLRERIHFEEQDIVAWKPPPHATIFFDPGRRHSGRRIHRPDFYQPPLSIVERWLPHADGIGVKTAPGIDYEALPAKPDEVEVISLRGEVKEAVLWFGRLAHSGRRATLLPSGATLVGSTAPPIPVMEPQAYLYEPDGAVIRAHLVEQLAVELGATKIDEDIAFLTTPERVETSFARAFQVDELMPFNLKRLRQWLRERRIGQVVVKKRGSPIDPQALERQLRLQGDRSAVLILTHVMGRPSVVVCDVAG